MAMMWTLLVALCVVACAMANSNREAVVGNMKDKFKMMPGKVVAWSNGEVLSSDRYVTKTVDLEKVSQYLVQDGDNGESNVEMIVVFTPEESMKHSCSEHSVVKESVADHAEAATTFKYVYATPAHDSLPSIMRSKADKMDSSFHTVRPNELPATLASDSAMLNNKKTDFVQVPLTNDAEVNAEIVKSVRSLMANKEKKIIFAAYDNIQTKERPQAAGNYADVLDTTTAATDPIYVFGSPFYKPEGGEYAIYYGGQYLYITPDIFTGLMTGLFVAFTLYTGISCLGSIQGMSSFYDKLPIVGKEA
jgi:hypothetical protein